MNTCVTDVENKATEELNEKSIQIVLIYEDVGTGLRAMQTYRRILETLGEHFDFGCHHWDFMALNRPDIREVAAELTAEADMIIFSAHPASDLPASVHAWFELWLTRKRKGDCALVAMLDEVESKAANSHASGVHDFLRNVADLAGLDFFFNQFSDMVANPYDYHAYLARRAFNTGPVLEAILHRQIRPPRWGLNE